jgi:hypothetical protein
VGAIQGLFDRSVADLQKSIADNDMDKLAWSLSPVIFYCSLAHSRLKAIRGNVSRNRSFVEKTAILLLTLFFLGILVMMAINYYSIKETLRQQTIEANKIRDAARLQAQYRFLDEVSNTLLTYETLALDISWFKTQQPKNHELFQKALARYNERIVDLIAKWRTLVSRAQTLASPDISGKLAAFLKRVLAEQDTPINQLYGTNAVAEKWEEQHRKNEAMLDAANQLIAQISEDLHL